MNQGHKGEGIKYIVVGRTLRPHGRRGAFLVESLSDWPRRFDPGRRLFLEEEGGSLRSLTVEKSSKHKGKVLITFAEVKDRMDPSAMCGLDLVVPEEELPELEPGQYWIHELIGLKVLTEEGKEIGHLSDVLDLPGQDLYVVERPEGEELLIPAVKEIVSEVDLESGIIRIRPVEGLL